MSYKILYVLVEGDDDLRFFEKILLPRLVSSYSLIKIWKYREQKKEKTNQFVRTIKTVSDWDYIFIADMDRSPCITLRKNDISTVYTEVEKSKITIVVKEIEGWYMAGLNSKACKEINLTSPEYTDEFEKEKFVEIAPSKMTPYEFKLFVLDNYSIDDAINKNKSLKYFTKKYFSAH